MNTPNLICPQKEVILGALNLYKEKNIDYIDAFNALILKDKSIEGIYSYDPHYDRVDWLTRLEP